MTVEILDHGLYLLNDGEDSTTVARRIYGDVHKSTVVLTANPGDWDDLERVIVPNRKGRTAYLQEGESTQQVIQRMFPNQPVSIYMNPFFLWNGGQQARLAAGELVFVPER